MPAVGRPNERGDLYATVAIQMRTDAGVKQRVVFEHHDGGLHSINCWTTTMQDGPTRFERTAASFPAGSDGFVRNRPGPAVNDQRWLSRVGHRGFAFR